MRTHGAYLDLDLTAVTFIDCSGINALLASCRHAQRLGGWMRVAGASPCVRRLIEITGLRQLLRSCPPARATVGQTGASALATPLDSAETNTRHAYRPGFAPGHRPPTAGASCALASAAQRASARADGRPGQPRR
jgi:hypothetical protein